MEGVYGHRQLVLTDPFYRHPFVSVQGIRCCFRTPAEVDNMGRKRSRSPAAAAAQFLSEQFPPSRPLKVELSALRSSQARILTRNLRAAGATVLSRADAGEAAVVVTDTVPRSKSSSENVTYVAPRWAQEVLKRRRCLSPSKYKVEVPVVAEVVKKNEALRVPAVWQNVDETDAGKRAQWLRALPAYAVQRVTYAECVFKGANAGLARALRDVARVRELLSGAGEGGSSDGTRRGQAYKNAAVAVAAIPFAIRAGEAPLVRDVGLGVAEAVREYVVRGEVREAELIRRDERLRCLDQLSNVYGIGIKSAQRLYEAGVRSVMQLHQLAHRDGGILRGVHIPSRPYESLTLAQATAFRDAVAKLLCGMHVTLCGGYRRGKSRGHDVDLVYCREDEKDTSSMHAKVTQLLQGAGLLKRRLHQEGAGFKARRYAFAESTVHAKPQRCVPHEVMHAVCEHDGHYFRADFVGVRDAREYCFATLAWSGSVAFQRSFRRYTVARAGLVFTQHGLFDAHTGARAPVCAETRTEHDVFKAVALTYRPPFERSD